MTTLSFEKTPNCATHSVATRSDGAQYQIVNLGKGAKPWQLVLPSMASAEQFVSLKAAMEQANSYNEAFEVEQRERRAAEELKAAMARETAAPAQAAGTTSKLLAWDPRNFKKSFLDQHGGHKDVAGKTRKVVCPMYVIWRMDGDMYDLCTALASAGLHGGYVTYEQLATTFGRKAEAGTDRHSGKGSLASLDRYLTEIAGGSKLNPFGWTLETTGKQSKTWVGASMRLVLRDGFTVPTQPLTMTVDQQAEIFCQQHFTETREQFGTSCAKDFCTDYDQTLEQYLAEHGNPSVDSMWFIDVMKNHGFTPVTR